MKIIEPKFWWNDNPSILIKLMSLPFGILLKILIFLRNKLRKIGIFVEKPITPWIKNLKKYPVSKFYFQNILSIPFHNLLQKKQINTVVKAIIKYNNENFN